MEYPSRDEIVVVNITKVLDYGVICEMIEYNNMRGFVHISNVSSSWVKNIRFFVKDGEIRAAKVLNVDTFKGQVDLSLGAVNTQRQNQRLSEYRQMKRCEKLMELLAKQSGKNFDYVWDNVCTPLSNEYGSLNEGLNKIALGEDVSALVPKELINPLKELVEKNIVVSEKELKGIAHVESFSSQGLSNLKEIFSDVRGKKDVEIIYVGGGNYQITVKTLTYKASEKLLSGVTEAAEKKAKKLGAKFEFKKIENK